jgi:heat shock protein 1/8
MKGSAKPSRDYAIGIDLGTANTCTAILRNDQVEIIPHEGRHLMPSYVAFTESGHRLVGSAAKSQASMNSINTVYGALRFIGRKFADPEIQRLIPHLPFEVRKQNGKPIFGLWCNHRKLFITPVEIIAMILARAYKDAMEYLCPDDSSMISISAVISVPACFDACQRQAISDAALIAAIPVLYLISNSASACTDYTWTHRDVSEYNIMMLDVGAGFVDVALATLEKGIVEMLAMASATCNGGDDIDNRLVRQAERVFGSPKIFTHSTNPRALRRLQISCEQAKLELSSRTITRVEIEHLSDERDFTWTITRNALEDCCSDLLRSCFEPIERVIQESRLNKTEIHAVVLVGGSSRIPKLQTLISEFFNPIAPPRLFNPEEAVARGAAIYAAIFTGEPSSRTIEHVLLLDISRKTVGVETLGGVMTPIMEKNLAIPSKKSILLSTSKVNGGDGKPPVIEPDESFPTYDIFSLSFFDGESAYVKDNKCLGVLKLSVLRNSSNSSQIEVELEHDRCGNVTAKAKTRFGDEKADSISLSDPNRLQNEELEAMMATHNAFKDAEAIENKRIASRNSLERYIFAFLTKPVVESQHAYAKNLLEWLDANQDASEADYTFAFDQLRPLYERVHNDNFEQGHKEHHNDKAVHSAKTADRDEGYDTITSNVKKENDAEEPRKRADEVTIEGPVSSLDHTHITMNKPSFAASVETVDDESEEEIHVAAPSLDPRPQKKVFEDFSDNSSSVNSTEKSTGIRNSFDHGFGTARDKTPPLGTTSDISTDEIRPVTLGSTLENQRETLHLRTSSSSTSVPGIFNMSTEKAVMRSSTPRNSESTITELFTQTEEGRPEYTDADFTRITTYLNNKGRPAWSRMPRIYTVLRLINQLEVLEAFIEENITDVWLPFTLKSLPTTLSPTARSQFIEHQKLVLSKSLIFETDLGRKHVHFANGEPLPFEVIAKLGAGAHGHVDKVISTVSGREFARKLFRRQKGAGKKAIQSFIVELQALKKIQHHHCIELVRISLSPYLKDLYLL